VREKFIQKKKEIESRLTQLKAEVETNKQMLTVLEMLIADSKYSRGACPHCKGTGTYGYSNPGPYADKEDREKITTWEPCRYCEASA
jgi:hypothetical protein